MNDTDTRPLTRADLRKALEAMRTRMVTVACVHVPAQQVVTSNGLTDALATLAADEPPEALACPSCGALMYDAEEMRQHKAGHHKPPAPQGCEHSIHVRDLCAICTPPAPATALPPRASHSYHGGAAWVAEPDYDALHAAAVALEQENARLRDKRGKEETNAIKNHDGGGRCDGLVSGEDSRVAWLTAWDSEWWWYQVACADQKPLAARVREMEAQLAQPAPQPAPASEVGTVAWRLFNPSFGEGKPGWRERAWSFKVERESWPPGLGSKPEPLVLRSAHEAALAAARAQAGKREAVATWRLERCWTGSNPRPMDGRHGIRITFGTHDKAGEDYVWNDGGEPGTEFSRLLSGRSSVTLEVFVKEDRDGE